MNYIETSYLELKHFVLSDANNKIMAVIKVEPGADITTKVMQAISEDEDCHTLELLNSFEMNEVNIYLVYVKITFENLAFEEKKYYNLTPVAIY